MNNVRKSSGKRIIYLSIYLYWYLSMCVCVSVSLSLSLSRARALSLCACRKSIRVYQWDVPKSTSTYLPALYIYTHIHNIAFKYTNATWRSREAPICLHLWEHVFTLLLARMTCQVACQRCSVLLKSRIIPRLSLGLSLSLSIYIYLPLSLSLSLSASVFVSWFYIYYVKYVCVWCVFVCVTAIFVCVCICVSCVW